MKRSWFRAIVWLAFLIHNSLGQGPAKWLAIAASNPEIVPIIRISHDLRTLWPEATVVASNDCVSLRPGLYLAVAEMTTTRSKAETAVQKLRANVPDAYVRQCHPKPNTTLAFGLPLVDATIAEVPSDSVNWSDRDRISSVRRLSEHGYLWIRRKYVEETNDPLEGRVVSVIYFEQRPQDGVELQPNCVDPEQAEHGVLIALNCAREVAGDYLLHETIVFDTTSGSRVKSIQHCRKPSFESGVELTCEEEHVGAQGKLELTRKRFALR